MVSFGAIVDHGGPATPKRSLPESGSASVTPVAVIGMACRLPGGIDSPERLWEALLRGDDLVTDVPPERWDAEDYYDAEPGLLGRSVSKWGAFLDDVAGFDSDFFGIDEAEAEALDPQHRLLLETSWEAFEHAGVPPRAVTGSQTGVFVGLTHVDYQLVAAASPTMGGPYGFQGSGFSMASGRIAHALRVHGPAVTVDTAGSSSLLAVHMACRSLNDGESDLALAGGACVMLEPRKFAAASALSFLSPTGRCRAFDAAADGVAFGEGAGMVLLKRLPDALRDGDRILAVVRGTAVNQDGDGAHLGTPTLRAQSTVYRKALAAAGVDPGTVGMVEAHGPGTPSGDSVEYASLAEVYGVEVPCAVTSAKTNLGHTQSAAGVLGLIKTALALQHGVVPHNLHFTQLPDDLATIETKLFVPQRVSPWTTNGGRPRRAAVSAYGLSGTNVHGVLEQAPVQTIRIRPVDPKALRPLLFPLSSTSAEALRGTAERLADWLDTRDDVALHDLAYTLARRRAHRPVRTVVGASSRDELVAALRGVAGDAEPHPPASGPDDRGPVWVLTGDDAPWTATGAKLLAAEPVFAATVARAEPVILAECGFSVTDEISGRRTPAGLDRAHPTLFTMQVALAAALEASGVRPAAVIGHSVGETAAAVVAGALSLEDGLRVVCRRSTLLAGVTDTGATASVELPAQQVLSELSLRGNEVVVAAVPSPALTVIAGAAASVRELVAEWQQRGVQASMIPGDVALHSAHVDAVAKELTASLAGIEPTAPKVPYYSASSFDPRERPAFDARYWGANVRRMVRFSAAVRAALEDGHRVVVELSPQPTLTGAIQQTAVSLDLTAPTVTELSVDGGSASVVDDLVSRLHCVGAEVDFSVRHPTGRLVDAPLPAWSHRQSWFHGDGLDESPRGLRTLSVHPLLGPRVKLHEETERHVWSADVGTAGDPASVICEMALAAAGEMLGDDGEVRDLRFERPLLPDDDTGVGVEVSADAPDALTFVVANHRRGERVRYATAVLAAVQEDSGDVCAPDGTVAEVALDRVARADRAGFGVHPALLDACFRSVAALAPTRIGRLRIHGSARGAHHCLTRVRQTDPAAVVADFEVVDRHGTVLLLAQDVLFATGAVGDAGADRVLGERLSRVEWLPRDLPAVPRADAGAWLIGGCGAQDGLTANLADALEALGAHCRTVDDLTGAALGEDWAGVVVVVGEDAADESHGHGHVGYVRRLVRDLTELSREPPRLHVVTRSAQAVLDDDRPELRQAGLRGLLKVLGNERPDLRVVHVDVDDTEGVAASLARQFLVGSDDGETAWRRGGWFTARLSPMTLLAEHRRTVLVDPAHDGMRLHVPTPGDLDSTELIARQRVRPGPGQIEVSVRASAVNFADVLAARDRESGPCSPGVDFVGVVTAVGQDVTDLRVGDRVGGVIPGGGWAGFVTCDANVVVPLPAELSDGAAAAVTTAYAIAYHGLHDLAHLADGDRVLIHSATGGVGQAAIAIARAAGAEIFATAGSPARRDLLHDMGLRHVYDSRSTEFTDLILRDTHGYGVDVVLNSLPAAGRRAGLELLAFGGRFVEIGQRDVHGDLRIGLGALRRNMAFHAADLGLLAGGHPERFRRLLGTVYQLTAEGSLPLPPSTHFPLSDAASALRTMNDAEHVGRLVLDAPSDSTVRVVESPEDATAFRGDGAYVVTGAEDEPTLVLVGHMAAAGAGRIVLSSPTEPSWASLEEIEAIRLTGADVVVEVGAIGTAAGAAERLVAVARATGLPLCGVLHVGGLSGDDWAATVSGAWDLHLATLDEPLDWFCCFASTAALLGSPGRADSAAAGSWLDAFARWRRAQGLPATTIAWADWAEFTVEDGIYAFDALLRHDVGHVGYAPTSTTDLVGARELRAELDALPTDEWPPRLRRVISEHVSAIVRHTIDADRPLPECGIDSMGALELLTRIEAATGVRVRPAELTTIRDLADLVCDGLAGAGRG